MDLIDTDVAIETPEHIVFRYRLAGPGRRALAHLVDQVVCFLVLVVGMVATLLVAAALGHSMGAMDLLGLAQGLLLVLLFAVEWGYFVYFEATRGASLGKLALGMKVVTTTGQPIGFSHAALRNLLRAADAMPLAYSAGLLSLFSHALALLYPAGLVAMLITKRLQRIGDVVAGTVVVIVERTDRAEPIQIAPPSPAEQAELPPSLAIDAEERSALELFLRRRKLGEAREQELAQMIAPTFAERHGLRYTNPVRVLALLYDRARSSGRGEGPPSSRGGAGWL
ncbi:MAG: RDD family protein [Myxococcales bacterium]|nr:RDD family protein [Myxococcales bacterium]